jgi:arylsulfatase A-like enzyme
MSEPTRRDVLHAAMMTIAASALQGRVLDAQVEKPNILWLVSEDNNPFLGCYGDALAHTPNIDALAKRGLLFRHAYSAAPVCAPSRFGILTGVHPESCAPANHMRANATLPALLRTYPEYLRDAGYYCTNNAKTDWNCNADPARVFDESSAKAHWKNRPAGVPFFAIFNHESSHETSIQPRNAMASTPGGGLAFPAGAVADASAPRNPRATAENVRVPAYLPATADIRDERARYYQAITRMDAQIGDKLKELADAGLADDTIVFYYSDNGGVLPRSKRYCYDDGLHVALVVAFPPKWQHLAPATMGTVINTPVSLLDLAPTLLSLVGAKVPAHMQGTAFLGPQAGPRGRYAFGMRNRMDERYDFSRAVTDGRYHYIRNYSPHRVFQHGAFEWQAKGYQSWEREFQAGRLNEVQSRFFTGTRPFEEFYDVRADPDSVHNLVGAPSHAPRLAEMRRALDEHMIAIVDNGFIPEGMPQEGYDASRDAAAYPLPRLMGLAAKACARDARNVTELRGLLADPHALVRHWAAQGLLMLGTKASAARGALETMMRTDTTMQNRVVAAEAVATMAPSPEAVNVLATLLDGSEPMPVRLQAINALTFLGEQSQAALPQIKRAAEGSQQFLRNCGRYLEAVLEGRYDPTFPVFDLPPGRPARGGGA